MIWNDPFYLGKNCTKNYKKLKYRISNRMVHPGVYLLTFPRSGQGILEIIPSLILLQEHYPTDDLTIVGMGATRREAISIVEQIVSETVRARGDADVAAYMSEME
ncbi:MAG: hypothetical protein LUE14_02440 [Clostridiales bacterium]|nr:hypothetical protein [Clostridiales bacterium]MCD8108951.1 hypothetical protein [Clostridiales bacterium]MCD8132784.1 hypothetical protein [Clostridiales bacterium]